MKNMKPSILDEEEWVLARNYNAFNTVCLQNLSLFIKNVLGTTERRSNGSFLGDWCRKQKIGGPGYEVCVDFLFWFLTDMHLLIAFDGWRLYIY